MWWLLALYVLFHGVSKAQLFINTGSVYLLANTTDIHRLGYLARTNPDLYQATVLGASSLMGLPPTLGFAAKALMIYVMFEVLGRGGVYAALYIAAVAVTSVFSIVYSMKYLGVYVGALRGGERPTARLPREQLWAEKALGWLSVALVPMAIAVPVVPAFSLALAAIYVVSLALLLYTFRSGVPRVVPIDEVWLGGVSP